MTADEDTVRYLSVRTPRLTLQRNAHNTPDKHRAINTTHKHTCGVGHGEHSGRVGRVWVPWCGAPGLDGRVMRGRHQQGEVVGAGQPEYW